MDTPTPYTPADIATEFGVSRMTIRNWTQRYSEFLSDSATPEPGTMRRFTERDRVVIGYIAQMVSDGARHEHIAERLRETQISDAEVLPHTEPEPTATDAPLTPTAAPQGTQAPDAMLEVVRILGDVQTAKLSSIDERLSHLESRQHSAWLILAAFAVGVIVTVLAVMLAMNAF